MVSGYKNLTWLTLQSSVTNYFYGKALCAGVVRSACEFRKTVIKKNWVLLKGNQKNVEKIDHFRLGILSKLFFWSRGIVKPNYLQNNEWNGMSENRNRTLGASGTVIMVCNWFFNKKSRLMVISSSIIMVSNDVKVFQHIKTRGLVSMKIKHWWKLPCVFSLYQPVPTQEKAEKLLRPRPVSIHFLKVVVLVKLP